MITDKAKFIVILRHQEIDFPGQARTRNELFKRCRQNLWVSTTDKAVLTTDELVNDDTIIELFIFDEEGYRLENPLPPSLKSEEDPDDKLPF